jgi:hypothetical protein
LAPRRSSPRKVGEMTGGSSRSRPTPEAS